MIYQRSSQLFAEAQQYIPGGVNSPVRAFKGVGGTPLFIKKASGAYLYDEDGNQFIDYINSWGPMILGHAFQPVVDAVIEKAKQGTSFGAPTAIETAIAQLVVTMVPNIDKIRFVNSGTEACMSAVRLARGFTKREKIIKFSGCYHGHSDSFLIAAGSGASTFGVPNSAGVTQGAAQDTLLADYNSLSNVQQLLEANKNEIAAIIIEPVAGNMGCVPPKPGFLEGLRKLCDEHQTLLIFDEVMTGFRLAKGGAQELFGIKADIVCFGKVIGGGLPVGAFAARNEIMSCLAPLGPVYQAGTLSGRPTPPTSPTTSCRPPPSWNTGISTPATGTPTCCSTARPSHPWARRAPTPISSARWPGAWVSTSPASPTTTSRCAAPPSVTRWTSSSCWTRALPP